VDLEEFSLLACKFLSVGDPVLDGLHFPRLFAESEVREDRGDDGADGQDGGRDRGEDGRAEQGHAGKRTPALQGSPRMPRREQQGRQCSGIPLSRT
jgi:hypothetical protein